MAEVRLESGEIVAAHVPNTGRMRELLVPEASVLMAYHPGPNRKTDYTLLAVTYQGIWVSIHAVLANAVAAQWVLTQPGVTNLKREVTYGNSRFDLGFNMDGQPALFEVKSVNLVVNGQALFPDAPTLRGSKHLLELIEAKKNGFHAGILFVVLREDAHVLAANAATDPIFAENLARCRAEGLTLRALGCSIDGENNQVSVEKEIPVIDESLDRVKEQIYSDQKIEN